MRRCIILLSPKAKGSFILMRKKYTVYVKKYLRNSDGVHCLLFAGISLAYKWNLQNGSLPSEKQSNKFLEANALVRVQYVRCVQKRSKPLDFSSASGFIKLFYSEIFSLMLLY